ncbi:hypothetical protein D3C75_695350 [compost metagenome]
MVQDSISEVRESVKGITEEIGRMSTGMDQVQDTVEESQRQIEVALQEFTGISTSAQELDNQAREVLSII